MSPKSFSRIVGVTLVSIVLPCAAALPSESPISDDQITDAAIQYWELIAASGDTASPRYAKCQAIADLMIQAGEQRNNRWLKARGLARRTYAFYRFGDWDADPLGTIAEARKLTESPSTTEEKLARAEVLAIYGYTEWIWQHKFERGQENLQQARVLAWQVGDDLLLAGVYRLAFDLELQAGYSPQATEFALQARHYAEKANCQALVDTATSQLLFSYRLNDVTSSKQFLELVEQVKRDYPEDSSPYRAAVNAERQTTFDREKRDTYRSRFLTIQNEDVSQQDQTRFAGDFDIFAQASIEAGELQDLLLIADFCLQVGKDTENNILLHTCQLGKLRVLTAQQDYKQAEPLAENLFEALQKRGNISESYKLAVLMLQLSSATDADGQVLQTWRQRLADAFERQAQQMIPVAYDHATMAVTHESAARAARLDQRRVLKEESRLKQQLANKDLQAVEKAKLLERAESRSRIWMLLASIVVLLSATVVFAYRAAANRSKKNELRDLVSERTQQLEKTQQEAEAANAAKGRFLAWINHELRNPLSAVCVSSELLLFPGLEDDDRNSCVDTILAGTRHLTELVEKVLDFSRIDSGDIELHETEFRIVDAINEVQAILYRASGGEHSKIAIRSQVENCQQTIVRLDQGKLRQILINLGNNAIQHTSEGSVTISASIETAKDEAGRFELCVAVSDTGVGIPLDVQDKLFTAFATGNKDVDAKRGTGLGLYICKMLIQRMDGQIECESKAGFGSTFRVRLPVQICDAAVSLPEARSPFFDASLTALLIDDNPLVLNSHAALLEAGGVHCRIAHNWEEAEQSLSVELPDLVLTDIKMPEIDGFEVLQRIHRKLSPENRPRVVAVTGNADSKTQALSIAAGFDGFVTKPVTVDQLERIFPAKENS